MPARAVHVDALPGDPSRCHGAKGMHAVLIALIGHPLSFMVHAIILPCVKTNDFEEVSGRSSYFEASFERRP